MKASTLHLSLAAQSYPIHIGASLLTSSAYLAPYLAGRQIAIVTHPSIAHLYLDKLLSHLNGLEYQVILVEEGEEHKSWSSIDAIITQLIASNFTKDMLLIALGGGVIGDLAGFAAACYQRGVNYIQIPTSLIAQVDAAIGGKTAINHPRAKNMIGAFHQPQMVLVDLEFLLSLPQRDYIAGLAEVVKYALISNKVFFEWLMTHVQQILAKDPAIILHFVKQCCQTKVNIVQLDEKDQGLRAVLNFGHTVGHALEAATNYTWRHGEAVAMGIVAASYLSYLRQTISLSDLQAIVALLNDFTVLRSWPESLSVEQVENYIQKDKKRTRNGLRFVILAGLGEASIEYMEQQEIRTALEWMKNTLDTFKREIT